MIISTRNFPDIESASQATAIRLANALSEAIADRGQASIAVSGGRTPPLVFSSILQQNVLWDRVTVTLTDERWVSPDHADSNERLVKEHLLVGPAKAAKFIPMFGGENSPQSGLAACENRISSLGKQIDVIYLGMGADGHIASLFPGHSAIEFCDGLCVAVSAPGIRPSRMSLTSRAILQSKNIFLLFAGADKRATFEKAKLDGPCRDIPVRLLYGEVGAPVEVITAP